MLPALLIALLLAIPAAGAAATPAAAVRANEDGVAHLRAGRLEEAVAAFRAAIDADPSEPLIRRNLAAALATLAGRLAGDGAVDRARPLAEEAAALDPADARYPLLLGSLHFARGDLYQARRGAERALEIDPALAPAHELAGDVAYREGNLDAARRSWEAALPGAGSRAPGLRAKLERIGREAAAEPSFGRDVSRHFTVQYDGPVPAEVAREALRLLEEAYDRIWGAFGRPPQHDLPVILYGRERFHELNPGSPRWAGGAYDGKIRVPVGGLRTAAEAARLGPVLAHELAHAFLRANAGARLPRWFEEGLAERFGGADPVAARAAGRTAGGALGSFAAVDAALLGGPHVEAAYAAALLAVEELVRRDGLWLPRRVVELVADGTPFPEAFRRAAGTDLAEFEERWAAGLR